MLINRKRLREGQDQSKSPLYGSYTEIGWTAWVCQLGLFICVVIGLPAGRDWDGMWVAFPISTGLPGVFTITTTVLGVLALNELEGKKKQTHTCSCSCYL
jgi:hypothetical protein